MENGYMSYLQYLANKILRGTELKALIASAFSVLSFFFDPLQQLALTAIFSLIIIDFALGVAAAKYTKDKIRSAKVVRTAIKFTVYFTLIAAARVTEHALPFNFLDETVMGFLAATELLSILENTGRMGFAVPKKLVELLSQYISGKDIDSPHIKPKSKK